MNYQKIQQNPVIKNKLFKKYAPIILLILSLSKISKCDPTPAPQLNLPPLPPTIDGPHPELIHNSYTDISESNEKSSGTEGDGSDRSQRFGPPYTDSDGYNSQERFRERGRQYDRDRQRDIYNQGGGDRTTTQSPLNSDNRNQYQYNQMVSKLIDLKSYDTNNCLFHSHITTMIEIVILVMISITIQTIITTTINLTTILISTLSTTINTTIQTITTTTINSILSTTTLTSTMIDTTIQITITTTINSTTTPTSTLSTTISSTTIPSEVKKKNAIVWSRKKSLE